MTSPLHDLSIEVAGVPDLRVLGDPQLLAKHAELAAARRQLDARVAVLAAEVGRRSQRELGYAGLAQRAGDRTPERLVARVTGLSVPESRAMISAGAASEAPWMAPVSDALAVGEVSVGAAAAIRSGLGEPDDVVSSDDLLDAARAVLDEAGAQPPEQVARRAREARDDLDEAGVVDRERALRDKRFLKLIPQADGMTRLLGLLDPESAARIGDAIDLVTAPRRGGPRFVDDTARARAQRIIDDPRSTEQLALDALVEMVRIAGAADTGRVFGSRRPAVRVHVSLDAVETERGAAMIEGQTASVSAASARRIGCAEGFVPLLFDGTTPLDLGRSERLFTSAQRTVLAAIWGGCAITGCDRPPSWTEAHHIDEWDAHGGRTDVRDGALLCLHHHRWLHDIKARIVRTADHGGDRYALHVPGAPPVGLETKNPVRRRQARVA